MSSLAAIVFGAVAVTFGAGLGTSLDRVYADLSHLASEPVQVSIPGAPGQNGSVTASPANGPGPSLPSLTAQEQAVQAALRTQPGTLRYVAESDDDIAVLGLPDRVSLIGFAGDASWTGYALISGHWYSGGNQADVNTAFLTDTGAKVGDSYTVTSGGRSLTLQIAGEIFDQGPRCAPSSGPGPAAPAIRHSKTAIFARGWSHSRENPGPGRGAVGGRGCPGWGGVPAIARGVRDDGAGCP